MNAYFTPASIVVGVVLGAILAYYSAKKSNKTPLQLADAQEEAFYNRLIEMKRRERLAQINNFGDADF